jgi:hypothetical protein
MLITSVTALPNEQQISRTLRLGQSSVKITRGSARTHPDPKRLRDEQLFCLLGKFLDRFHAAVVFYEVLARHRVFSQR